ncbi:hypothetical protein [Comamonas aquatica]|uniref:hypothetical protein n=1 Tax=Comamonas aquatica TaxID=225991 RepID=UPI0012E0BF47|nr:hypothetical protein [Comamonas aquatica]
MKSFLHSYQQTVGEPPLACAPHASDLTDEKLLRIAQVVYEVTEQVRCRLKADEVWGAPVYLPPRGFHPTAKPEVRANFLAWPALLTMDKDCLAKICQVAGCSEDELKSFVLSICPYEHLPHLEQFFLHRAVIKMIIKEVSAEVQPMKAKQVRIRKGASTGGLKSALRRKRQTKIPSAEVLMLETAKLLASGKDESETAGILSRKFGVSAQAIRLKRRQA